MTENIVDLALSLEGSSQIEEYLVRTPLNPEELVEKAEKIMEEEEKKVDDCTEIKFYEHKQMIEDRLDAEFIQPIQKTAMCPNTDL